jgi:16S rRNA (guanine966-N2)-methyltransferase
VIAGKARGTRLKVPPEATRPSTDRLREALFSILEPRIADADVLDLFAGSGALGIEALSRGARAAQFVEADREAARVIEENLRKARLTEGGRVVRMDVFAWLEGKPDPCDLVLADPPYAAKCSEDLAARLLAHRALPTVLREDGLLVIEVEKEREPPEDPAWELQDRRVYGDSAILFYAPKPAP